MSGMEIPAMVAIGSSVVGAGASIYGTMQSVDAQGRGIEAQRAAGQAQQMAAQEQARALEFEGKQYDLQGQRLRSAAAADEASRRDSMVSSLETIQVLRSGRGLSLDSPTGRAIMSGVTSTAEHNIESARTNYMLQASNSDLSAELARRKARYSLMAGDASAKANASQIDAMDAQIGATVASGVSRVAGIATDLTKTLRYGGTGFAPGSSASP